MKHVQVKIVPTIFSGCCWLWMLCLCIIHLFLFFFPFVLFCSVYIWFTKILSVLWWSECGWKDEKYQIQMEWDESHCGSFFASFLESYRYYQTTKNKTQNTKTKSKKKKAKINKTRCFTNLLVQNSNQSTVWYQETTSHASPRQQKREPTN